MSGFGIHYGSNTNSSNDDVNKKIKQTKKALTHRYKSESSNKPSKVKRYTADSSSSESDKADSSSEDEYKKPKKRDKEKKYEVPSSICSTLLKEIKLTISIVEDELGKKQCKSDFSKDPYFLECFADKTYVLESNEVVELNLPYSFLFDANCGLIAYPVFCIDEKFFTSKHLEYIPGSIENEPQGNRLTIKIINRSKKSKKIKSNEFLGTCSFSIAFCLKTKKIRFIKGSHKKSHDSHRNRGSIIKEHKKHKKHKKNSDEKKHKHKKKKSSTNTDSTSSIFEFKGQSKKKKKHKKNGKKKDNYIKIEKKKSDSSSFNS